MRESETSPGKLGAKNVVYFKLLVPVLLALPPLLAKDQGTEGYWLMGKYALAASVIFLLGVHSSRGIWIVGSSMLGVISIGFIVGLTSSAEMAFILVPFGYVVNVAIATVGAMTDIAMRFIKKRKNNERRVVV
jgi:hypothetical protein